MHISFDGKIMPAGQAVLLHDNKSYRYGDGLFETIKMVNGAMPLFDLHMERLFTGLKLLGWNLPFPDYLRRKNSGQILFHFVIRTSVAASEESGCRFHGVKGGFTNRKMISSITS
jgi:branched-subunit amino acid aminotransferase/4-amino-4-deoxychorismate lyase